MPATNYSWQRSGEHQLYHMYGTKRKPSEGLAEEPDHLQMVSSHKRQCTEAHRGISSLHDTNEDCDMIEDISSETLATPPTHSNKSPTPVGCHGNQSENMLSPRISSALTLPESQLTYSSGKNQQYIQLWNNRVPPLPDHTGDHDNVTNNNSEQCLTAYRAELNNNSNGQASFSQDDMIMDINNEVYSTHVLPSMPTTDAEYEAACSMMATMDGEGAPDQTQYGRMVYCDQFCAGGHPSPSSGQVRCVCKQSWEGLQDVRPYVSDYY